MRHGAERCQAQFHGKKHVAGPGKLTQNACAFACFRTGTQSAAECAQHLFMPDLAKTAACTVVRNFQSLQSVGLQLRDFGRQAFAALMKIRLLLSVAKIHLIDDGQHGDLKQDRVQPGAFDRHLNFAAGQRRHTDVLFIELEQS